MKGFMINQTFRRKLRKCKQTFRNIFHFLVKAQKSINKQTILEDLKQTRQRQVPLDVAFSEIININRAPRDNHKINNNLLLLFNDNNLFNLFFCVTWQYIRRSGRLNNMDISNMLYKLRGKVFIP